MCLQERLKAVQVFQEEAVSELSALQQQQQQQQPGPDQQRARPLPEGARPSSRLKQLIQRGEELDVLIPELDSLKMVSLYSSASVYIL